MKELPAILATYAETATDFDKRLEQGREAADVARVERIRQRQRINDSAYFILAWGQLENEINNAAESAVRTRLASTKWDERRAWDAYDPDRLRAKFEDRVALVMDRANQTSNMYRKTMRYYGLRNNIAHGKNMATGLEIAQIIADFFQIASAIAR